MSVTNYSLEVVLGFDIRSCCTHFRDVLSFLKLKFCYLLWYKEVLPRWLSGKESACSAGATGNVGSIPGSGRSLGGGNGNPLLYTCQDNPMDGGSWQAIVHEVTKVGYDWICMHACDTHKFLHKNQCRTEKEGGLFNLHKFDKLCRTQPVHCAITE